MVQGLTLLRVDPAAAVAPNADLAAWSRLGSGYDPAELVRALKDGSLLELQAMVRPAEDIALYRADMAAWPGTGDLAPWRAFRRDWVAANGCLPQRHPGPSGLGRPAHVPGPSRDRPDSCSVPWQSSGWTNNRNVTQLLEMMVQRGEVAVAGREGRERLWDLAERVYPDVVPVPAADALRERNARRLRSLGIARASGPGRPAFALGRQVHGRRRSRELFGFDYQLEMYKPAAKRRWGYFALPILFDDRLVGKPGAAADRDAGVLRVNAIHRDVQFTPDMSAAVQAEIEDLARWLKLEVSWPR